ncbi:unnamed protein product [Gordionus sp. m RMFG-2023]
MNNEPLILYKPRSQIQRKTSPFIDCKIVRTQGGKGGNGGCSFIHLYGNNKGGTGGGNGGNGGHVIFKANHDVQSLSHMTTVYKADDGEKGGSNNCDGKNAEDLIIQVPLGTIFLKTGLNFLNSNSLKVSEQALFNQDTKIIAELNQTGDMFIAARGGSGGKGNSYFTDSVNKAPLVYEKGANGEKEQYLLEMRTIAHFGLIGFPNVGKSTLLRAVSRANPKIAPYPFTTIRPQLGIMKYSDGIQLKMADLPGLIQGSHLNKGLGYRFLRHAQRCILLIYMLDFSTPTSDHSIPQNSIYPDEAIKNFTNHDRQNLDLFREMFPNNEDMDAVSNAPVNEPPWDQFELLRKEIDLYFSDPNNRLSTNHTNSYFNDDENFGDKYSSRLNYDKNSAHDLSPHPNHHSKEDLVDESLSQPKKLIDGSSGRTIGPKNENKELTLLNTDHYKYIVLGTKFDLGPVCLTNLGIFRHKYPDTPIFPISASKGYNIKDLMVQLRKIYDCEEENLSISHMNIIIN